MEARFHNPFSVQIGIRGTPKASYFHENENKKIAWLNILLKNQTGAT